MSDEPTTYEVTEDDDDVVLPDDDEAETLPADDGEPVLKPEDETIFPDGEYPEEGIFGYGDATMAEADAEKAAANEDAE